MNALCGGFFEVILLTSCGASTESQESYINYNLQGLGGEQRALTGRRAGRLGSLTTFRPTSELREAADA